MNAADILFEAGKANPGGITNHIFYAPISDFETVPQPTRGVDLATYAVITGDFVFKAGKGFKRFYSTLETGELKHEQVGPRDGKSFENTIEVSFPGNSPEFIGFSAVAAIEEGFIIVVKERNGVLRVLGEQEVPAFVDTNSGTSGKANADARATVVTFKAASDMPAPIYDGVFTLAPAA